MRLGWHSTASIEAPAMVAARGWAPPMPPRPPVRIHLPAEVAAVVLAADLDEGLVGSLDDALAADVDPRPGGHLAVHHQARASSSRKCVPASPSWHEVGVGDQHAGRVRVGAEDADRLAALHEEGLVLFEVLQALDDVVKRFPAAGARPIPP